MINKGLSGIQAGFFKTTTMLTVQGQNRPERAKFNAVNDFTFDDGSVTEPVTLAEVKSFCKLGTGTAEDTVLELLITAARQQCEAYCNIGFIPREVTAVLNNSCGGIYLPYGPVQDIVSVTDWNDEALTVDEGYTTQGTKWVQLLTPHEEGLTVVYNAGYGDDYDLPGDLKLAVLQQVFYLYRNRGEISDVTRNDQSTQLSLSPQAKATMSRLRRVG